MRYEVLIEIYFILNERRKQNQNEGTKTSEDERNCEEELSGDEINRLKNGLNKTNAKVEILLKTISRQKKTQLESHYDEEIKNLKNEINEIKIEIWNNKKRGNKN